MSKLKGKWLSDFTVQEIPSGTVNGANTSFALSTTPYSNLSVELKLDGRPLYLTTDYTISGTTITMVVAPAFGQQIDAKYIKRT
jgi:hypothetical protein